MKLYVLDKKGSNNKSYLDINASTRRELYAIIGSYNFKIQGVNYTIDDVIAEADSSDLTGGATVGIGVGLIIAGPIGALIGGAIGGILGGSSDNDDMERVRRFNQSDVYPKDKDGYGQSSNLGSSFQQTFIDLTNRLLKK